MLFFEVLKSAIIGIIQGITEWLPISSTGHMILADEFIKLGVSTEFKEMYFVIIQLGSILAVVLLFFNKLNPFSPKKSIDEKKDTWTLWFKVIIAALPAAVVGFLFDDIITDYLYGPIIVSAALIIYGILFIILESRQNRPKIETLNDLNYRTAFLIGIFQVLALIPGTSRSGSTILGATILGTSRVVAAEFSFFLAIPMMLGASLFKLLKYIAEYGVGFSTTEWAVLIKGSAVAFIVSLITIKFLMGYIRKHDFKAFGWYRIVLGIIVILYFTLF